MISFPNAKINLGLNVLHKRDDGFHELETIFYPVKLADALEVIESNNTNTDVAFTQTGLAIEGKEEDNLCIKAYRSLKKEFHRLPPVSMHLHKAIPMGAGLGGGSSDAAAVLRVLNEKFSLGLSTAHLRDHAADLGSDCPFFIINEPCFASGRGEVLEPINIDLSEYTIVLVNPGIHINTGWAFSQISPANPVKNIMAVIDHPISAWKDELKNDFELAVFEKYPEIEKIKSALYNNGAVYASLSGSGSTVFGIFEKEVNEPLFQGSNYFEHWIAGY